MFYTRDWTIGLMIFLLYDKNNSATCGRKQQYETVNNTPVELVIYLVTAI